MSLNNIRIVLIATTHPGNIGAAARAMLTMGLTDLYLVNPAHFPDKQATTMASGADSVLAQATTVASLQQAITDCHTVIGTSARNQRAIQWPLMDARSCGEFIAKRSTQGQGKVALVFGRESSGLTNEELESCQFLVSIPVNPNFSSLNLAAAVQVLSYECAIALEKQQRINQQDSSNQQQEPAANKETEVFYQHLEKTLIDLRYLDPDKPRLIMRKLRSIIGRIGLAKTEINLLHGILSAAQGRKFIPRDQRDNSE